MRESDVGAFSAFWLRQLEQTDKTDENVWELETTSIARASAWEERTMGTLSGVPFMML